MARAGGHLRCVICMLNLIGIGRYADQFEESAAFIQSCLTEFCSLPSPGLLCEMLRSEMLTSSQLFLGLKYRAAFAKLLCRCGHVNAILSSSRVLSRIANMAYRVYFGK